MTQPGPLVDPAQVPDWLRELVEQTASRKPDEFGLPRVNPPRTARPAAVLVLFGEQDGEPDVLLLRRADNLNSHPGQVAFPGGALDPSDDGPVEAALREAEEEVGVERDGIRPLATLPELWVPHSGFRVTPVIAHWWRPSPVAPVDPAETAAVARVPISWLTDPDNRLRVGIGDRYSSPAFLVPGMLVWGFTGGLLSGLLELGGWARHWGQEDVRDLEDAWRAVREAEDVGFGKH